MYVFCLRVIISFTVRNSSMIALTIGTIIAVVEVLFIHMLRNIVVIIRPKSNLKRIIRQV